MPKLEGWQISPFYQPAREVGGDFYDFHLLSEGQAGTGRGGRHGQGRACSAGDVHHLRHAAAPLKTLDSSSPGEVLERVNETLVARIPPNMFVTCFYAILDPKSGSLDLRQRRPRPALPTP